MLPSEAEVSPLVLPVGFVVVVVVLLSVAMVLPPVCCMKW